GVAEIVVEGARGAGLTLEVRHVIGNDTLPPLESGAPLAADDTDEDEDILAPGAMARGVAAAARVSPPGVGRARRSRWLPLTLVALAILAVLGMITRLEPVLLDVRPADAQVRALDTWIVWRSGDSVFLLPGEHRVRATHQGYLEAVQRVQVIDGENSPLRLRLAKLPGRLLIDTAGVAASVRVDGAPAGHAPGEIEIGAGERTVLLQAERHLDYVVRLSIAGAGERQRLTAKLLPSWGVLRLSTSPASATVMVDDREVGITPVQVDLPAGVHRVRLAAPRTKDWESSIVVQAGETLSVGPVTLGEADAELLVRSDPAGADVSVAQVLRGRTPITLDLAPGVSHDVLITHAGYASFTRTVFARSGERTSIDAHLAAVTVGIAVHGEPADAQVLVDGIARGDAPLTLELAAGEHRLEVRKDGFAPYSFSVPVAPGLVRTVQYRLLPPGKTAPPPEVGSVITTKAGGSLKLLPAGTFLIGSDRREQGRRPNESLRRVTLTRAFYIGVHEVTNAEFRKFRPDHNSGFIEKKTIDLDAQPVTQVTWDDAAEYCNWLSEQEGLTAAYDKAAGRYVLKTPLTNGYRLPTEAEWEYAARLGPRGSLRRFAWGDDLPVPEHAGNFAGTEARGSVDVTLDAYHDDYVTVAPVGKFAANGQDLYDMAGNVSEWANDFYSSFVEAGAVSDPLGPDPGPRHVIRGSSWHSGTVSELRLAWRDAASEGSPTIGFRLARTPEP
ncbi:MAG TPA: SUMF1/EgtB/PvdO family nonheme iron enzyme, partial [Steroidobacteraceae bacterium]